VLLQEQVERETEATLRKTAWAAMTCRATVGEQPWSRFPRVEVFGVDGDAAQGGDEAKGKYTQSQQITPSHSIFGVLITHPAASL
jgi:hypothetical protein